MIRYLIAAVAAAALLIWFLIGVIADINVRKAVNYDAVDEALHWGGYMSSHVPDLQSLVETGVPNAAQLEAIHEIGKMGNVFRFNLFDLRGELLFSVGGGTMEPLGTTKPAPDPEALAAMQTGMPSVSVVDGTGKPDRPDLYAEAYVPLIDARGNPFGVAEVYVDETATQRYFANSFANFGWMVSLLSAALFLMPTLAYGFQWRLTKRSQSRANYLAKFDVLTGLLNRAEFTARARQMVADEKLSALLFLDADNFKSINDIHGHGAGDRFLAQVGRVLMADASPHDLIGRFGGDEFVVALCEADHDTVMRRLGSILEACSQPVRMGERTVSSSVSIGVSLFEPGMMLEDLVAQADVALYFAKQAGRNQFALYTEQMGKDIRRRNRLERRIREATKTSDFSIQYQPLVDGTSHEMIGYEALIRLKLEDGTPVSPAEFIPIAEQTGLIDQIGEWALRQAIHDIAPLPHAPKVAINLSVAQFRSGELPRIVAEALADSGLEPGRLELEVTETLLLEDDSSIAHQIDSLQEMGVSIAMDDFGTGFSSLGYLWKYGFDRIKIDRSFIAGLSDNSDRSLEIIETVVLLGKRLGMQVTAEGVETREQSEILSKLGCDTLQGYFFGHPDSLLSHQDMTSSFESGHKKAAS